MAKLKHQIRQHTATNVKSKMHSCQKKTFLNFIPGDSKIKAQNRLNWTSRKSTVQNMTGSGGAALSSARAFAFRLLFSESRQRYENDAF